jgi:hypothetical protein
MRESSFNYDFRKDPIPDGKINPVNTVAVWQEPTFGCEDAGGNIGCRLINRDYIVFCPN